MKGSNMIDNQTLQQLRQAEYAVTEFYPYVYEIASLEDERNKLNGKISEYEKEKKTAKTVFIIGVIMLLVAVIIRLIAVMPDFEYFLDLDPWGFHFGISAIILEGCGFAGLILIIICGICFTVYSAKIKKKNSEIAYIDSRISAAHERRDSKSVELKEGLTLWSTLMPKETIYPQYARVYIEYLEQGRANTLGEARDRFDEIMHRERMEQMAKEQIETARRIEDAANRAASNAAYAAMAAQNAANRF